MRSARDRLRRARPFRRKGAAETREHWTICTFSDEELRRIDAILQGSRPADAS